MRLQHLPFDAPLAQYEQQADSLLAGHRAQDPQALELIRGFDPRLRREGVRWLPRELSAAELSATPFELADARATVASAYSFEDWSALAKWADAVSVRGSVFQFEAAVESIIDGELSALRAALARDPALVHARSTRRCCFDPPEHRATLLHYVAANGVEHHRQRSPRNSVEIARCLLEAGAEVDALANLYGGECSTMSLLVSSSPPAQAGVQAPLVELLLDFGAALEGHGEKWGSPLATALVFGFPDVAELLARRGARADNLAAAAGLGRAELAARLIASAPSAERHLALALAAQLGRASVVRVLLDAGEDPDRYNPEGAHAHATPLHHAAYAGHTDVVELLVERGARLDLRDKIYSSTPLGWAEHAGHTTLASYLRERGAP